MQDYRFHSSLSLTIDLSCLQKPYSSDFGALFYDARVHASKKRLLRVHEVPSFERSNASVKFMFGKNAENILHVQYGDIWAGLLKREACTDPG